MFDSKFGIVLAIFLILFVAVTYMSLSSQRLPIFTRASNKTLSMDKSLVLISKLEAVADALDSSKITVFARNEEGVGIANRTVTVQSSLGTVTPSQQLTNNYGKAEFQAISSVAGKANLTVSIDNLPLQTAYSINFINP
jgi:hypothetical protein